MVQAEELPRPQAMTDGDGAPRDKQDGKWQQSSQTQVGWAGLPWSHP